MSGSELLRMTKMIEENAEKTTRIVADEVAAYITGHQALVADQLRADGVARVPSSVGTIRLTLKDLEDNLRARRLVA